jgi:hypothetical protein
MKKFKIPHNEILPMAIGYGSCLATDRITVDGLPVGYMYREESDIKHHNGWIFMSGDETQDYADNEDNWNYYDTNTIANYDPDITAFIESPIGSSFERDSGGQFVKVTE